MKKLSFLLFLACCCCVSFAQKGTEKIALIVAIGDYPKQGGWGTISSDKDIPLITNALIAQGFDKKNIFLLQDSAATKAGIIRAVNEKLSGKVKPGDNVVFHYSGHGQQVRDLSGDELDGYDEAIVPYDAPLRFVKNVYEGQNHLLDDELDQLFNQLRYKIGPKGSLTVILDACHSGTATRGGPDIAPARGSTEKMAPPEYHPGNKGTEKNAFTENITARGNTENNLAPLVVFSGASANELNYETKDDEGNFVGSLSYALTRALANAQKGSTYTGIFDKVRVDMVNLAPRQSPQIEGDIQLEIFAGKISEKQKYYKVEKWLDSKTLVINAGNLLGIYDNTVVAFYDIDTKDPSKSQPKATGKIKNASLVKADVVLDKELDEQAALASWVFVKEQGFSPLQVTVKLDLDKNSTLKNEVISQLGRYAGLVKISSEKPDLLVELPDSKVARGNQLQIMTATEVLLYNKELSGDDSKEAAMITKNILAYVQARFLRGLEMEDPDIKVNFSFIPITKTETITEGEGRYKKTRVVEKERSDVTEKTNTGEVQFRSGDKFKLKLVNEGNEVAYFSIVDIQPDNVVNVLIPRKGTPPAEYKILPGQELELDQIFNISPPFGKETFKLIATREPVDLSTIASTRGTGSAARQPVEKLFRNSYYENTTRGAGGEDGDGSTVPAESVHVQSVVFRIIE